MDDARIVVEQRADGNRLAIRTPLPNVSFPRNMFKARRGSLVKFHEELGRVLASLTEEQRASAIVQVELEDDGYPEHRFAYYHVETEEEYAARVAGELALQEQRLAADLVRRRELYERLKQEFG